MENELRNQYKKEISVTIKDIIEKIVGERVSDKSRLHVDLKLNQLDFDDIVNEISIQLNIDVIDDLVEKIKSKRGATVNDLIELVVDIKYPKEDL